MTKGHIHSWESMGLVDGPGVRTVIFLQGCSLRCRYCHNPDTWENGGETETPQEILERLRHFKDYYGEDGGVTFSGGEPLLQRDFLIEVLALCKEEGIHTCLDTAGCGVGGYRDILKNTDLVLFDVKHFDPDAYKSLTGRDIAESLVFLDEVQQAGVPLWIRHVVVPGLTDGEEHLEALKEYILTLKNVQKVELLPYHKLGVHKYHALNIPYSLEGVEPPDADCVAAWQEKINFCLIKKKEIES